MTTTFDHEGKTFEVRAALTDGGYSVKIFLNDAQVTPEYSAVFEVGQDYFAQHRTHILDALRKIAENDIRNGIYFQS